MGAKRCHVKGCQSAQNRVEDMGVTFHQLPAKLETRVIWLAASRVPDDPNAKVCSRHFREADFKLVKTKYFLIKGAYPSIFPWGVFKHAPESTTIKEEKAAVSTAAPGPSTSTTAAPSSTVQSIDTTTTPAPSVAAAKVKRDAMITKRHSIAVETIKKDTSDPVPDTKPLRKSMESAGSSPPLSATRKVEPVQGKEIEAMDFNNVWHKAKILEVDSVERELLIHFGNDSKDKLVDEWIPMDSSRLRPRTEGNPPLAAAATVQATQTTVGGAVTPTFSAEALAKFKVGEKCLARWSDSRKFKATVQKILPNGVYEVLFDDGFLKLVKMKHMSKLKGPKTPSKAAQLPQVNLVDGEEWYCQWVDDCPVGKLTTVDSSVPNTKVRMIEVSDTRLPPGWTKFFSERVHVANKWDVVIVTPSGRRFRGRQDIKSFIEESADPSLNLADFDFAMHKKRAKEKGVYTYTENYRKFLKSIYPSMTEIDTIPPTPLDVQEAVMAQLPPSFIEPLPETVIRDSIMVDGMKVQIIDNLLRCPEEGCFKNFRKENLLKIHIKHYHEAMAKRMSATPTMTDLAYKRTQSLVEEDVPMTKSAEVGVASPVKTFRKIVDKSMKSPDTSIEAVLVATEIMKPNHVNLEAPLSTAVVVKTEDVMPERIFPKATPLSGRGMGEPKRSNTVVSQKRKYTRRADLESPRQPPKKLKLEPRLDATASSVYDESTTMNTTPMEGSLASESGVVGAQPQQYIDENGDVIKIVRMRQEEIINCLCNFPEEDGLMIQCDLCLCWQHGRCNDIEKESQVPDKYVCYICRNPEKGRQSMKYVHDQDWLYDGKLPRSTYHTQGTANDGKRGETLKRVHTLTGNLLELKRVMHSLRVKMNIADNKDHPKLYLWSKRWEDGGEAVSPQKGVVKDEEPNVPKPEAAIDSRECQRRLMEHIRHVQSQLSGRLDMMEKYVDEIEAKSELGPMTPDQDAKCTPRIKQTMHMMMDDLVTMNEIAQC